MQSFYMGLYVIYANGNATDVQVKDPNGNSIPLSLSEYTSRGVRPEWESLPSQADYQAQMT